MQGFGCVRSCLFEVEEGEVEVKAAMGMESESEGQVEVGVLSSLCVASSFHGYRATANHQVARRHRYTAPPNCCTCTCLAY